MIHSTDNAEGWLDFMNRMIDSFFELGADTLVSRELTDYVTGFTIKYLPQILYIVSSYPGNSTTALLYPLQTPSENGGIFEQEGGEA